MKIQVDMRTGLIIGSRSKNLFEINYKGKVAYTYADPPLTLPSEGMEMLMLVLSPFPKGKAY